MSPERGLHFGSKQKIVNFGTHLTTKTMKNLFLLTVLHSVFSVCALLNAQTYTINFGASGVNTTLDSVFVENITKDVRITIREDFVLTLSKELGLEEEIQGNEAGISVFPNPVKGSCSFDFNVLKSGNSCIALYDVSGKQVVSHQEHLAVGWQYWQLTGLTNGMYFLKVSTDGVVYSAKVLAMESEGGEVTLIPRSPGALNNKSERGSIKLGAEEKKSGEKFHWLPYEEEDVVISVGYTFGYSIHYSVDPKTSTDIIFEFYPCIDSHGYKYPLTKIGDQIWMAENLKVTASSDSIEIPEVKNNNEWILLQTCARCWWQNDSATYAREYGALYNQFCVNQNVCPKGYRVPGNEAWDELVNYLGGSDVAGGKLKSRGTDYWLSPNTGATNRVGFNAHGGSARSVIDGGFPAFRQMGFWWAYEEYEFREMSYDSASFLGGGFSPRENGMAIRCIKN